MDIDSKMDDVQVVPAIAAELIGFSLHGHPVGLVSQMPTEVIEEIKKKISTVDPPSSSPAETHSDLQTTIPDEPESAFDTAINDTVELGEPEQEPNDVSEFRNLVGKAPTVMISVPSPKVKRSVVEGNLDDLFGTTPPDYDKDKIFGVAGNGVSVNELAKHQLKIDDGVSLSRQSAASPNARVEDIRVLLKGFEDVRTEPVVDKDLLKIVNTGSTAPVDGSTDDAKTGSEAGDSVLYAALAFPGDSVFDDGGGLKDDVSNVQKNDDKIRDDFNKASACKVAVLLTVSCGPWKPLHRAAQSGSVALTTALLDAGADIECQNPGGGRPLHVASQKGSAAVARLLLARKANLEAKDKSGWRPLHFAVGNSHPEVAAILIDSGASMECGGGKKGVRALHMAVNSGNVVMVALLCKRGAMLEGESQSGLKPLHLAAQSGNLAMTRALLDHGALVNGEDKSGVRPLYLAAHRGHTEVVRLLLQRGANPDHVTAKGMTPLLTAAMQEKHLDVATLLITEGRVNVENALPPFLLRPLHLACANGHCRMTLLLLSHGATLESHARNGATPLHLAATQGRPKVAELLLERGARVDSLDSRNMTPLHAGCAAGDVEVVDVLIRHGAALESRSADNRTPLDMAMANAHVEVVHLLLQHGAVLSSPAIKPTEAKNVLARLYGMFRS